MHTQLLTSDAHSMLRQTRNPLEKASKVAMETYMDINAHDLEGKRGDLGHLFDLIARLVSERLQMPMDKTPR
jgi:hypothetical protein